MTRRLLRLAVGLLALTAAVVLAAAGLFFLESDWVEPEVKFFRWEIDPDWPGGLLMAGAGILGVVGFAAIASARLPRQYRASGPCPQCGRAVAAGSPTCLGCGYNLASSPRPR